MYIYIYRPYYPYYPYYLTDSLKIRFQKKTKNGTGGFPGRPARPYTPPAWPQSSRRGRTSDGVSASHGTPRWPKLDQREKPPG